MQNQRPIRLAINGSMVFWFIAILIGLFVIPAIGAPLAFTWAGLLTIAVIGTFIILHFQPLSIELADETLRVRWLRRRRNVQSSSVRTYAFLVDQKYLGRDWPARFYSLHVYLLNGRRILVGGIRGARREGPPREAALEQVRASCLRWQASARTSTGRAWLISGFRMWSSIRANPTTPCGGDQRPAIAVHLPSVHRFRSRRDCMVLRSQYLQQHLLR